MGSSHSSSHEHGPSGGSSNNNNTTNNNNRRLSSQQLSTGNRNLHDRNNNTTTTHSNHHHQHHRTNPNDIASMEDENDRRRHQRVTEVSESTRSSRNTTTGQMMMIPSQQVSMETSQRVASMREQRIRQARQLSSRLLRSSTISETGSASSSSDECFLNQTHPEKTRDTNGTDTVSNTAIPSLLTVKDEENIDVEDEQHEMQQEEPSSTWIPPVYTPVVMTKREGGEYDEITQQSSRYDDTDSFIPTNDYSGDIPLGTDEFVYYGGGYGPDGSFYITPPVTQTVPDFFPQGSRHYEWMGRSLETLILGFASVVPILCLPEDEEGGTDEETVYLWGAIRRRSTVSTLGSSDFGPRGSMGSGAGYARRGSLMGNSRRMHGGTLANYYNPRRDSTGRRDSTASAGAGGGGARRGSMTGVASRRGSASYGPSYHRRRMNVNRTSSGDSDDVIANHPGGQAAAAAAAAAAGPNIALSLLAREATGKLTSINRMPESSRLKAMGGYTLFSRLDRPAAGMCSEVAFLSEVIDSGDWAETQTVISRIAPRLIGDPTTMIHPGMERRPAAADDPSLPPNASRFYAGGGRAGLERDAFVRAGGIEVFIRVFREKSFVGDEMAESYDARDLSEELVASRLAPCWNETLACLRELVYSIPSLVEDEVILDNGDFLPFLFTLLSHDSCFESSAALIEEILSLQSHSPSVQIREEDDMNETNGPKVRLVSPTTFFLGNVPDLYELWAGFNCRHLAHFCRILALLVFEPEDRQLLESPAVLKSIELLQLRRNRAARAGRDSTVDMNQSILLGDELLIQRLLQLLGVMNYAPPVRRSSPFHVMAQNPFIADTLVMLGLKELTSWEDAKRLDESARKLLQTRTRHATTRSRLTELGSVANMLDNLSNVLEAGQNEPNNQLGQIIRVISAAQQAGVVVSRARQNRDSTEDEDEDTVDDDRSGTPMGALQDLTTTLGIMTEQVRARQGRSASVSDESSNRSSSSSNNNLIRSYTPSDAANILQFNALLLGAFQVEVLFVLCTLLGGRRKIDAQEVLKRRGIIPILEDMFERLPWDSLSVSRETISNSGENGAGVSGSLEGQPTGIHGPGCECTPESALCVQYLRLLHNFCDRDCENYVGRRLLLSQEERSVIFTNPETAEYDMSTLRPGLLSKIITAFIGESDESPYRFWLASCVESYLRGSSAAEQIFAVHTGLLSHLINEITSQRLHCAGSLQTSFDLLGELCKGNTEVVELLVSSFDEERFRKLMSVAAANLVDSNVFIRSILLSLERMSSADTFLPLHIDGERRCAWKSSNGTYSRTYLTHSWWDTCLVDRRQSRDDPNPSEASDIEVLSDQARPSDWFPTANSLNAYGLTPDTATAAQTGHLHSGVVGHFGWVFTPEGDGLSPGTLAPNTVERLSWFLAANQTRLLRDLLSVVDLTNINHENICCLNTAVVITIFAYRRSQLDTLLQDLKRLNEEERETKRRAINVATKEDDIVDRAFVQAMKHVSLDADPHAAPYARRSSLTRRSSLSLGDSPDDRSTRDGGGDVLRNFREVLWFWMEYYTHRGRDRLSLEFSSHLRFQEWMEVVSLLAADNGSSTALVQSPIPLPRSPYQRAA
ncbi:DUF3689 domain containing protein [Nitzschia inconspicua]|uniref:DUF3689 domain containing protein n=1 Tax=Nitzschia inconspicua TaxID=303405 RepID=A0A9K3LP53_9STRA|nr:DUF3689 domain containing protein [Nitzschia inconspicua]